MDYFILLLRFRLFFQLDLTFQEIGIAPLKFTLKNRIITFERYLERKFQLQTHSAIEHVQVFLKTPSSSETFTVSFGQ